MRIILTKIVLLLSLICFVSSARTYDQRVNDYQHAVKKAQSKVQKFKKAIKSRDPVKIKKATLEIQEDPAAIKELNKESTFVKKKFVDMTDTIQSETIENIKQKVAKKYGVKPEDVRVKKFTNPSSEVKAGHDWDVTVSIKGEGEIPLEESKEIVHKAYYDAAGGSKAYPNSNPEEFAETHHVEVTNSSHAEAYEGGKKYIDNTGEHHVKDSERLSKTIEHKSHLDQKKASEYGSKGEYAKEEVYKQEQARQYTKQYDKHIKPRIKEMGGRVPDKVEKGTKILKKIGKYDKSLKRKYTPADADKDLAKIGETSESIIKKGSALVESGQKIQQTSKKIAAKRVMQAHKDLADAEINGDTKKVKKLRKKIAKIESELKNMQSKSTSSKEPLSAKTAKVSGASTAEEGALSKGAKGVGKALETAGTGAVIFNTAQDVKESLQGKKSWKETGKNVADLTTGGAISTTENTIKKNSDYKESDKATKKAQASENEAEILARGLSLRKSGVSKAETEKIMEDMRHGNNKTFLKKVHTLRKEGKIIPLTTAKYIDPEGPDDTYGERAEEVKKGLIKYGKRAGKFVKQTGKDVLEIGKSSIDTQKNIYRAYTGNKEADEQLEQIKKRLVKEGFSPEGAQIAIDRYKDGHKETLLHIIKQLNAKKKKREKEKKLAQKAKKLIKKSEELDKKAKAEEARERLKRRIEESKKEKLVDKAKAKEIDEKAKEARKRLEEKIAQSKKEDISNRAKELIAKANKADENAKLEEQKSNNRSLAHKKYKNMTQQEQHEALKKNSDEAWEGLKKDLLSGNTDDAIRALSSNKKSNSYANTNKYKNNIDTTAPIISGTIRGRWHGRGKMKGIRGYINSSGRFRMKIAKSGHISGSYSGDDKGRLGGHLSSSGKITIKSGGGMAGSGRWGGRIWIDKNGVLHGSGHWNVDNFSGSWHGTGK